MLTKSWKKALVQENRAKEVKQSSWFRDSKKNRDNEKPDVNVVGYESDSASDEDVEVCILCQSQTLLYVLL